MMAGLTSLWRMRLLLLPLALLAACAGGPAFDSSQVEPALTPRSVSAGPADARGKRVLWGGVILSVANLSDHTRLEVLAYPLDSNQRPQRDDDPLGRFIIERTGYLEPASYAEGRLVTAIGTVSGTETATIGAADYRYPVLSPQQLYLWPRDSGYDGTSVHFGIGVGIGF